MSTRVKGLSIIAFERGLIELRGPDAMHVIRPRLPTPLLDALDHREVLIAGMYPMEWFSALHIAAGEEFGAGISREIGRTATRHDVNTLYRFILKFLSPTTLMNQYGRLFGLFCPTGKVVVEANEKGSARVSCSGLHGASRGVWEDVLGSTEVLMELSGGKSPKAEIVSGGHGDAAVCLFSWR